MGRRSKYSSVSRNMKYYHGYKKSELGYCQKCGREVLRDELKLTIKKVNDNEVEFLVCERCDR